MLKFFKIVLFSMLDDAKDSTVLATKIENWTQGLNHMKKITKWEV